MSQQEHNKKSTNIISQLAAYLKKGLFFRKKAGFPLIAGGVLLMLTTAEVIPGGCMRNENIFVKEAEIAIVEYEKNGDKPIAVVATPCPEEDLTDEYTSSKGADKPIAMVVPPGHGEGLPVAVAAAPQEGSLPIANVVSNGDKNTAFPASEEPITKSVDDRKAGTAAPGQQGPPIASQTQAAAPTPAGPTEQKKSEKKHRRGSRGSGSSGFMDTLVEAGVFGPNGEINAEKVPPFIRGGNALDEGANSDNEDEDHPVEEEGLSVGEGSRAETNKDNAVATPNGVPQAPSGDLNVVAEEEGEKVEKAEVGGDETAGAAVQEETAVEEDEEETKKKAATAASPLEQLRAAIKARNKLARETQCLTNKQVEAIHRHDLQEEVTKQEGAVSDAQKAVKAKAEELGYQVQDWPKGSKTLTLNGITMTLRTIASGSVNQNYNKVGIVKREDTGGYTIGTDRTRTANGVYQLPRTVNVCVEFDLPGDGRSAEGYSIGWVGRQGQETGVLPLADQPRVFLGDSTNLGSRAAKRWLGAFIIQTPDNAKNIVVMLPTLQLMN
ncbi:MAG: hypothetical protein ROO73_00775 [Roseivirga sp.]